MNDEQLEDLMYRAGLTAQGCWDSMDQYAREAIMDFAALVAAAEREECAKLAGPHLDGAIAAAIRARNIKE